MKQPTVKLSWYERFLNNLNNTNLYVRQDKTNTKEKEEALKLFLRKMEQECYIEGYQDALKGDDSKFELDY